MDQPFQAAQRTTLPQEFQHWLETDPGSRAVEKALDYLLEIQHSAAEEFVEEGVIEECVAKLQVMGHHTIEPDDQLVLRFAYDGQRFFFGNDSLDHNRRVEILEEICKGLERAVTDHSEGQESWVAEYTPDYFAMVIGGAIESFGMVEGQVPPHISRYLADWMATRWEEAPLDPCNEPRRAGWRLLLSLQDREHVSFSTEDLWRMYTVLVDKRPEDAATLCSGAISSLSFQRKVLEESEPPNIVLSHMIRDEQFCQHPECREKALQVQDPRIDGALLSYIEEPRHFRKIFGRVARADAYQAAQALQEDPRGLEWQAEVLDRLLLTPLLSHERSEVRGQAFRVLRCQAANNQVSRRTR